MGLYKTSNFSIVTFINANDLKFFTRSYGSCVYRMMRFKKVRMAKFAKWWRHTVELYKAKVVTRWDPNKSANRERTETEWLVLGLGLELTLTPN